MSVCNRDCFNCSYTDCICNEPSDDLALDRQLDLEASRSYEANAKAQRKYRKTEKGKQAIYRWNHSDKHKKIMTNYNNSERGKERSKRFEQTEARKAYRREWERKKRLKLKEEKLLNIRRQ
ncbi:MAG: hypothetical protein ACLR1A_07800 [Eubacterium ventriosum]